MWLELYIDVDHQEFDLYNKEEITVKFVKNMT